MKIAVTVWNKRVSPLFDSAGFFLIVKIKGGKVVECTSISADVDLSAKVIKLADNLDIDLLICGALSCMAESLLRAGGVEVVPFISGEAEEVVAAFLSSGDLSDFVMPGCPRRKQRRKGGMGIYRKGFSTSCCRRVIKDSLTVDSNLSPGYSGKMNP